MKDQIKLKIEVDELGLTYVEVDGKPVGMIESVLFRAGKDTLPTLTLTTIIGVAEKAPLVIAEKK